MLGTGVASPGLLQYLIRANHSSVLEHASISVLISGVSRSFLAQITRHRMASYTSASQHYQDYSNYENIVHPDLDNNETVMLSLEQTDIDYRQLVSEGVPIYAARQVLPNAKAVNILWTINARSLWNFLNIRLCKRNVPEMLNFAYVMQSVAKQWWEDLFIWSGPDCEVWGQCRQGRMMAEECKGSKQIKLI